MKDSYEQINCAYDILIHLSDLIYALRGDLYFLRCLPRPSEFRQLYLWSGKHPLLCSACHVLGRCCTVHKVCDTAQPSHSHQEQ
jgi:hypothetical protein